jgi:hypothetical protein
MATGDHLERLSAVSPKEFVAARNRIVAELRKAGRSADAQEVARQRRPSAALWAINRLAATDRDAVASFVAAVDRLRHAQLRDPRATADARRDQRAALDALVARARALLLRSGLAASPSISRRISDTLLGAAADRRHAEALRRGEITQELSAPGFEAFSGARVPSAPLRLVPRPSPRPASEDAEAARQTRMKAADAQRRALEAEQLEREAAEHQRSLTRLRTESAEAHAKLAELQKQLRTARQLARRAAEAATRARRKGGR